ncbi:MAG: YutD family protein [Bacilli bacterium]|nr:YutD family protein [Bacilli bacterium]
MKKITINNVEYEILKEVNEALDKDLLAEKITDYFDDFDYIVGDWAYGKLRLKGFYESNNKKCKKINDISTLNDYIENSCAYGCKWFQIKRKKELKS